MRCFDIAGIIGRLSGATRAEGWTDLDIDTDADTDAADAHQTLQRDAKIGAY